MILRESETRFVLSFTSGGAANAEMWIRDWIDTWGLRVHVMDRTMSLAAINVTGPLAKQLLVRAGLADPPRFLSHVRADVAGVPCHVMRLSFTGEAAWELHHPIDGSVALWRRLMELGQDLGIRPHGLQALFALRLEKGHVIVGMDTELDSTPRRLGMDWAARMDKPRFIGRAALERTAKLPDHRRLLGFTMDGPAPVEGSPIWSKGDIVGHVTGSWASPVLGRTVMLGWQKVSPFVDTVEIDGRTATVTPTPVLRPGGPPCPRLSRWSGCESSRIRRRSTRRVGTPRAIRPSCSSCCASPPTRSFAIGGDGVTLDDPDAIVEDERGYVGAWCAFDAIRAADRVVATDRATGPRPGFRRGRARQGVAAGRRRRAGRRDRGARRRPRRTPRVAAMTVREPHGRHAPADPLAGPPEVVLRRRHHRGRRARPVHRLLPRDAPRDHERGRPRGGLHRIRQHRPEHDDHPRQLRHPAGGPLLQAQPGHVRRARGRDRREPAPPDARHPVVRPHRDDDADGTGPRARSTRRSASRRSWSRRPRSSRSSRRST